jgi:hypothetical protein
LQAGGARAATDYSSKGYCEMVAIRDTAYLNGLQQKQILKNGTTLEIVSIDRLDNGSTVLLQLHGNSYNARDFKYKGNCKLPDDTYYVRTGRVRPREEQYQDPNPPPHGGPLISTDEAAIIASLQDCATAAAKADFLRSRSDADRLYEDVRNGDFARRAWNRCAIPDPPGALWSPDGVAFLAAEAVIRDWAAAERRRRQKASEIETTQFQSDRDKAADAYRHCLMTNAVGFAATSKEPAETVVKAALASCKREDADIYQLYRRHADNQYKIPSALLDAVHLHNAITDEGLDYIQSLAGAAHDTIIKAILETRAAARPTPPEPSMPRLPPPSNHEISL